MTKTTAATAMAVGEKQQCTNKGMTEIAMATKTAMVTDGDNNDINANTYDSVSTT